jgi:hypothetical protein
VLERESLNLSLRRVAWLAVGLAISLDGWLIVFRLIGSIYSAFA